MLKISKWKNLFLLSALFFMLIIVFEIFPKYYEILSYAVEIITSGSTTEQLEDTASHLKGLTKENKNIREGMSNLILSENNNISSIISVIDVSAERSFSTINLIKPGPTQKKNNLNIQPLSVEITSDYESLFNFIRSLENSDKVIEIEGISIVLDENGEDLITKTTMNAFLNL